MFDDRLDLADAAAATKHFDKFQQGTQSSVRRDSASTMSEPRLLEIRHSVVGPAKSIQSDRHNVLITDKWLDDNGVLQQNSISITPTISRSPDGVSRMPDLYAFAKNFLASSTFTGKLERGES